MNVIDLFAGCGGLSLGFEMAGFNIPLAVEKDEWASETYKFNHPNTTVITNDITQVTDLSSLGLDGMQIDGIISLQNEMASFYVEEAYVKGFTDANKPQDESLSR